MDRLYVNRAALASCICLALALLSSAAAARAGSPLGPELLVPEGEPLADPSQFLQLRLGRIRLLAYSHDSRTLAVATEDGPVCLWTMAERWRVRCLRQASPAGGVTTLAFSPDNQWLALGRGSGSIDLYPTSPHEPAEPCPLLQFSDNGVLGRAITSLLFPAFAGGLLAVGQKGGTGRRWQSPVDGKCPTGARLVPEPTAPLAELPVGLFTATAMDPTGQQLAIAVPGALGIWDLRSGKKLWLDDSVPGWVHALAISPDGRQLVAGFSNGGLRLLDLQKRSWQLLDSPHQKSVLAVAFAPDSQRLAAGSEDHLVSIFDTRSATQLRVLSRRAGVTTLAFRPDGSALAAGSEDVGVTVWDTTSYAELTAPSSNADWIRSLAFGPQGKWLATGSDDGMLRIWEHPPATASGPVWSQRCYSVSPEGPVRAVAVSPNDGALIAVSGESRNIRLFRSADCTSVASSEADKRESENDWQKSLTFSPDGRLLASGGNDGTISLLDVESRQSRQKFAGFGEEVSALAFGPVDDNPFLAAAYYKTVRLWNIGKGAEDASFVPHSPGIKALAISPDGQLLAVAAAQKVSLWAIAGQRLLGQLNHDGEVSALHFNHDGSQLATAERTGKLHWWSVAERRELSTMQPPTAKRAKSRLALGVESQTESVFALAIEPQSQTLAAATLGRVLFWQRNAPLPVHTVLWQGTQGWASWTANDSGGTLFRHDSGEFLMEPAADGRLSARVPPLPDVNPQLALTIAVQPSSTAQESETIIATIANAREAGPALWLRWEIHGDHDLRSQLRFDDPAVVMRLAPGAKVSKEVLNWQPATRRWPLQHVNICMTVTPQYGQPAQVCRVVGIGRWRWQLGAELLFTLLLGGALLFLWRSLAYRERPLAHPAVQATLAGQNPLLGLTLKDFPAVEQALQQALELTKELRQQALTAAGIDELRWQRALAAAESPASCAGQLAESLTASLGPPPILMAPDLAVYRVAMPPLGIYVSDNSVLILCSGDLSPQTALAAYSPKALHSPNFALIVDLNPRQNPAAEIKLALAQTHPATHFVVLSESVLVEILFANGAQQAKERLRVAILTQCELRQVLLYREGASGFRDDEYSFFFGRQLELQLLLARPRENFLLVGPQQMGKSSLLHILRRELQRRHPEIKVLKKQLYSGELRAIADADRTLEVDSAAAFYKSVMSRGPEHQIFLLDEVDLFVTHEKQNHYPFCKVMQALSAEGRASFILTGHQALHDAVRTADHPLRYFGQVLRLGPLDPAAAERMILEPLTALGLHFSEPQATVDWLRTQTACRPNLLAYACASIVQLRKPLSPDPLTLAEVQTEVLAYDNLYELFGDWDDRNEESRTDRAVMQAALLLGRATLTELHEHLGAHGTQLPIDEIDRSVNRLYVRYYALVADPQGHYYCPLPLLRHFLSNSSRTRCD